MAALLSLLGALCGIGSLICFIIVVVKMFQHGDTTPAILSLVLILCVGIGGIVAFVFGWMKAGVYGIQNLMLIWTGCVIGGVLFNVLAGVVS